MRSDDDTRQSWLSSGGGSPTGTHPESSLGSHTCCSSSPVTLAARGAASWSSGCSADPGSTRLPLSPPDAASSSLGSLTVCKMCTGSRKFSSGGVCVGGEGVGGHGTTKLLKDDPRARLTCSHIHKGAVKSVQSFRLEILAIQLPPAQGQRSRCKSWPDL